MATILGPTPDAVPDRATLVDLARHAAGPDPRRQDAFVGEANTTADEAEAAAEHKRRAPLEAVYDLLKAGVPYSRFPANKRAALDPRDAEAFAAGEANPPPKEGDPALLMQIRRMYAEADPGFHTLNPATFANLLNPDQMGHLAGWLDDVRQNGANGPTPAQIKAHRVLAAADDAAAGAVAAQGVAGADTPRSVEAAPDAPSPAAMDTVDRVEDGPGPEIVSDEARPDAALDFGAASSERAWGEAGTQIDGVGIQRAQSSLGDRMSVNPAGPDPLVAKLAPLKPSNPWEFVVERDGTVKAWRMERHFGSNPLQDGFSRSLEPISQSEKQRFVEWLVGASANYAPGVQSPEERQARAKYGYPGVSTFHVQRGPTPRNDPAYSPANLDLGTNNAFQQAISSHVMPSIVTAEGPIYNISAQGIAAVIKREVGDPSEKGRGSKIWSQTESTTRDPWGYAQMSGDTWLQIANDSRTQLNAELRRRGMLSAKGKVQTAMVADVLKLRSNADIAAMGIADYAKHNLHELWDRDMLPSNATQNDLDNLSYIMHHEGTGSGLRILQNDYSRIPEGKLASQLGNAAKQRAWKGANCGDLKMAYVSWLIDHTDQTSSSAFMRDARSGAGRSARDLVQGMTQRKFGTPAAPLQCPKPLRSS